MDEYKKGTKLYLPTAAFDDYAMTKKDLDDSTKADPEEWDGEVVYEVQILRRLTGEVTRTLALKEI